VGGTNLESSHAVLNRTVFMAAAVLGVAACGGGTSTDLSAPHLVGGKCVAALTGCPATYDDAVAMVDCSGAELPANEVGTCDGYLTFHVNSSFGDGYHLPDSPYLMCFYDAATKQLLGQRHCSGHLDACGAAACVETPGAPTCEVYTRTSVGVCPDAGSPTN
jgi:hypothetical protein